MSTAVLISGGLDSAVLLAEEGARGIVQPMYVSVGLAWEAAEQTAVRTLLAIEPLHGRRSRLCHWPSICATSTRPAIGQSRGAPRLTTRPTRTCICRAEMLSCWERPASTAPQPGSIGSCLARSRTIPSPTRPPAFRSAMAEALSLGLAHPLTIDAPFAGIGKAEVIRRGAGLPCRCQLTLSCMNPQTRVQKVLRTLGASLRALRHVQQMPRTARRISGGRDRGSPPITLYAIHELTSHVGLNDGQAVVQHDEVRDRVAGQRALTGKAELARRRRRTNRRRVQIDNFILSTSVWNARSIVSVLPANVPSPRNAADASAMIGWPPSIPRVPVGRPETAVPSLIAMIREGPFAATAVRTSAG